MVPWRHWWRPTAGAQQARSKRPDGASQAHGRRAGAGRCAPGKGCGQVDDAPGGAPGAARGQRRRCPPPAPFAHLPTALHDGEKNLQYTADVYNDSTRCASLLFAGASGSYLIWKRLTAGVQRIRLPGVVVEHVYATNKVSQKQVCATQRTLAALLGRTHSHHPFITSSSVIGCEAAGTPSPSSGRKTAGMSLARAMRIRISPESSRRTWT